MCINERLTTAIRHLNSNFAFGPTLILCNEIEITLKINGPAIAYHMRPLTLE